MHPHTIIFIGSQGSGKGTQAKYLSEYLVENDLAHSVMDVETGKLFRALTQTKNATADRVRALIENGNPVPDFVTNSFVMADFRDRYMTDMHITLDGYPRNVVQAKFLDDVLAFYDRPEVSVVHLDTPEAVARERMLARGRQDDTEETITQRLQWSMEMMEDLLGYYRAREATTFVTVDGTATIEEVQAEIRSGLNI